MQRSEPIIVPVGYPTALIAIDKNGSQSGTGPFVMGAIKVRQSGMLERSIHAVRETHGYYDREFKFSRITAATVPVFTDLISVLEASDAHLVASVVSSREHGPVSRDERRRTEPWQQHAVIISRLLRGCVNKRELVSVLLDGIATPPACSLSDTVRRMTNQGLGSLAVVGVASLNSKTNDLLQVADLVAGAVRHERVRDRGAPRTHKGRVAMRLANAFDCPGLADMRTGRVNIYTYRPPARRARRPDGLRVLKPSSPCAG